MAPNAEFEETEKKQDPPQSTGLKKHMSREIWGKKPLRLTLPRYSGARRSALPGVTYVVFVVVRVQVLVMGHDPSQALAWPAPIQV